jgi:hypothetical protein
LELRVVVRVQISKLTPCAWMNRSQVKVKMKEGAGVPLRGLMLMGVQRRRFHKRE